MPKPKYHGSRTSMSPMESVQKKTGQATDRMTICKTTFESPDMDCSEASILSLEQSDVANNGESNLLDIDGFQKVQKKKKTNNNKKDQNVRRSPRGQGTPEESKWNEMTKRRHIDPSNIFKVKHPSNYTSVAESLGKPKVFGAYSLDHERDFGHDKSLLHFLAPEYLPKDGEMKVEFDLNKGLTKFNRYAGNVEETLHNFLRWIVDNKDGVVDESSQRLNADFVSMKGNFIKVMKTPYTFSSWILYATAFGGSVYMINPDGQVAAMPAMHIYNIEKWGHTFEHYMRGGDPEDGVDANEEYRCVLKTVIGGMSLMYALAVDCADKEEFKEDFEDLSAFLFVNSCLEVTDDKKKIYSYKSKQHHWLAETQLSGIPRMIVGFRNNDGIVHTLKLLKPDELPEIAEGRWNPNVGINFLVKFLRFVKERVNQDPGSIYKFHHEEKGHIYCTKLNDDEAEEVNFLPSWYTTKNPFAEEESEED